MDGKLSGKVEFPGGRGLQFNCQSNIFTVNGQKYNAMCSCLTSTNPVDQGMYFCCPAVAIDDKTLAFPLIAGIIPAFGALKEELNNKEETERLGENLTNVFDVLDSFQVDAESSGFAVQYIAVTFKNMPNPFIRDGTLQGDLIGQVRVGAMKPVISSGMYKCKDTLDDSKQALVGFNHNV